MGAKKEMKINFNDDGSIDVGINVFCESGAIGILKLINTEKGVRGIPYCLLNHSQGL